MKLVNKFLVCLVIIPILSFSMVPSSSFGAHVSPQTTELETVKTVAQILDLFHSKKGQDVWPGYDLLTTPVIIWFNNGHIYAFNLKSTNPAWKERTILQTRVKFSEKDLWGIKDVEMHPAFSVENQPSYVFHMDMMQGNPYIPFLVFIHERFHSYQFEHFANPDSIGSGYQYHTDIDNLALVKLEENALLNFINANNSEKLNHLKDFAAVHQVRYKRMNADSIAWERNQQRMEGMADYASLKALETPNILPRFSSQRHLHFSLYTYLNDESISDTTIKRRHYGVGATLGYALDYLSIQDWKKKVQDHARSLDELVLQALSLSDEEAAQRCSQVKEKYRFNDIRQYIANNVKEYKKEIDGLIQSYQTQKGVDVYLNKPPGQSVSGGGEDRGMYYLHDGSTISVKNSSTSMTDDKNWNMSLDKIPYLIQEKSGERHFKVENDLTITLDGKRYTIDDLMQDSQVKAFKTISWKGSQSEFKCEQHPGYIKVDNKKLIIDFI